MKRIYLLSALSIFTVTACVHAQNSKNSLDTFVKVKDMSCEQLMASSKDSTFVLNTLAGLRAHKKCKDFKFNWSEVPDTERKIYQTEINDIITDTVTTDPVSKDKANLDSIKDLKAKVKKEKNVTAKIDLMKQLRTRYRSSGKRAEASLLTTEMYNLSFKEWKKNKTNTKNQENLLETGLLLARQTWSQSSNQKAEEFLTALARNLKGQQNLIEVYYIQGRIDEENEKLDSAVNYYDLVLEEFEKNPPKNISFSKDKIQWIKSWILYKTEQWDKAYKSLEKLAATTVEPAEKSRAHFFMARSLNKLDKKDEANKLLDLVTQEDFFSYYSLLAYQEMGKKVPAFSSLKSNSKFNFDKDLKFLTQRNKDVFQNLIKHEELDLAERAIMYMSASNLEKSTNMALVLAENGNRYLPLFAAFSKLTNEQKQDVIITKGSLLFPRVYAKEVSEMVEKTGLPASLIYSIMKQESAFNENTRSHANAYGLMQVIPNLAKQLARKYKLDYKKPEDLYNPQINIKLGSFELSEQVRKQNDQYTFVAAAYNAGPNALARWLRTRWKPHFDVIDFIEEIPYDETKLYVKVIARNHLFYDRLENPDKPLDFPEKFIKKSELVSQN
ncbi:MAG: transglycosylase SLT domain-containing protein [Pseudobdellovibrio sp.]